MKILFILMVGGLVVSSFTAQGNPPDLSTAMALSGVGLLSTSIYCAARAAQQEMLSRETGDRYQRRALVLCRNNWLKGAAASGLSGFLMIQPKISNSSFPGVMGVSIMASSVMLAGAALLQQEEKNCHEEFVRTMDLDVLAKRNHLRVASIVALCTGVLLCLPLITEEEEIIL